MPVAPSRSLNGLHEHPVYAVMPSNVKLILSETARRFSLQVGERPPENCLYFLTRGALGLYPLEDGVCVGMIAPGSVLGWEGVLNATSFREIKAILDCQGYVVRLDPVRQALGDHWIMKFLATYTASRARILGVEASCNAQHGALQRVAKWILRLNDASADPRGLVMTQGQFADLLGLQRTSINAVCRQLQDMGGIHIRRGRMIIADPLIVSEAACLCDDKLQDGAVERRRKLRAVDGQRSGPRTDRGPENRPISG